MQHRFCEVVMHWTDGEAGRELMPSEAQYDASTQIEQSCSAQCFYKSDDNMNGADIAYKVISVVYASYKVGRNIYSV